MGNVTYHDGVAILQLIVFVPILFAGIYNWKLTGWRVGSKLWRYIVVVSLLRIAGSICSMLTINIKNNQRIYIAEAVCSMIGIAPLTLMYLGLIGLIDVEKRFPPKPLHILTLACIIALIISIVGVNQSNFEDYHPNKLVKASMGIFLASFAITMLLSVALFYQLSFSMRKYQKKLFMAIGLSAPFFLVRLIYSAICDFGHSKDFSVFGGNNTAYLCMSVLEEIVAIIIVLGFGYMALREKDFMKPTRARHQDIEQLPTSQAEPKYYSSPLSSE